MAFVLEAFRVSLLSSIHTGTLPMSAVSFSPISTTDFVAQHNAQYAKLLARRGYSTVYFAQNNSRACEIMLAKWGFFFSENFDMKMYIAHDLMLGAGVVTKRVRNSKCAMLHAHVTVACKTPSQTQPTFFY